MDDRCELRGIAPQLAGSLAVIHSGSAALATPLRTLVSGSSFDAGTITLTPRKP